MSELSPIRVVLLGLTLVGLGAVGFHEIPGMIAEDAEGTKMVNAVYCSVITLTTVGFGDICPGEIAGAGRTFIVILSLMGLGMFCGPIMDLSASWQDTMADKAALLTLMVSMSVVVFSFLLEEMSGSDAAYFSIITGTTIGYGDVSPKSDIGKLAVALYAVLAVNVVASLLEPAKEFLLSFCLVPSAKKSTSSNKNQSTRTIPAKAKTELTTKSDVDDEKEEDATNDNETSTKKKKKKKKKKKGNAGNNNNQEGKKDL